VSVPSSLSYSGGGSWALAGADIGLGSNSFGELKHMFDKEPRSGDGGTERPGVLPN